MAKVKLPMLAFGASGQIGKSLVFGSWKGVRYGREYVTPSNPRTTAQTGNRTLFGMAAKFWRRLPVQVQAIWEIWAQGRPITGGNGFNQAWMETLAGQTELTNLRLVPTVRSAPPVVSMTALTGTGTGQINVTWVAPDLPPGFARTGYEIVAWRQQSPLVLPASAPVRVSAAGNATAATITGLTAAQSHVVWVAPVFTDNGGRQAVGQSLSATAVASGV